MNTAISVILGLLAGLLAGKKLIDFIKDFTEDRKLKKMTDELKNKEEEVNKSKEETNIQKGRVENAKEDFYSKLNKYNDNNNIDKQR